MKTLAKLIRYAAVSAVSTVTALMLLGLLVGLAGAPAGWSNAFATAVATVPSFELNRRWVWGARAGRSLVRQAAPFFVLSDGAAAQGIHQPRSRGHAVPQPGPQRRACPPAREPARVRHHGQLAGAPRAPATARSRLSGIGRPAPHLSGLKHARRRSRRPVPAPPPQETGRAATQTGKIDSRRQPLKPGRRFSPTFSTSPALVAQWIEHRFPKPGVVGSIPTGGAVRFVQFGLPCF